MMKKLVLFLFSFTLLWYPFFVHADPREDYEEAYKLYIAAGASGAAYSDRIGELATRYLAQDGWQIDHYVQAQGHTGARFLIAKKEHPGDAPEYLIAIVGTENNKDLKTDLKVDKIYFAGSNTEEFTVNANKKDVPNTEPKVHKGFNEFIQAVPSAVLRNPRHSRLSLPDLLMADKNAKVYLTGHSLGGAAATLVGARLLSMGINPEQIEVITFGAPAVGNAAFAAKFEPILHLTRIVNAGDPVTGVLQTLVGGYQQFGREIKWTSPDTVGDPHKLVSYVDSAIKNYYDKRSQAVKAGMELSAAPATKQTDLGRVYIASLQNNLPPVLTEDFWYMHEALKDEYRKILPDYVIADTQAAPNAWREAAVASGCRWAIISEVSAFRVKQERSTYYITVTQAMYDVTTDTVVDTAIFSTGTYNLTPLEAFIHAFKGINIRQNN
jgi:hypothetical protein